MDTQKETADQEQETPDTTPETEKGNSTTGNEQQDVTDKKERPEEQENVQDKEQKQEEEKEPAGDEEQSITNKEDKTDAPDPHRGIAETPSQHTALDPEGERNNDREEYKQPASGEEDEASTEGRP